MKKRKRIVKKKIAKEMVKRIGDSLIKDAEGLGGRCYSFGILFHEIEKPECLKCLDRERMQEQKKK